MADSLDRILEHVEEACAAGEFTDAYLHLQEFDTILDGRPVPRALKEQHHRLWIDVIAARQATLGATQSSVGSSVR